MDAKKITTGLGGLDYGANPHLFDQEAEQGVISLAFEDYEHYSIFCEAGVTPDWFCDRSARALFEIFGKLFDEPGVNEISDFTVRAAIRRACLDDKSGESDVLTAYFSKATQLVVPPSSRARYITRLLKAYQRRLQLDAAQRWIQTVLDPYNDSERGLGFVDEQVSSIRRIGSPFEILDAETLAAQAGQFYRDRLDGVQSSGGEVMPLEQQILSKAMGGGFQRKELTLISAPPKVGKTALAMRTSKFLADQGQVVLYLSLEMPRLKWMNRLIQQETGIQAGDLESGKFHYGEKQVFDNLVKLSKTKLYLIDDPQATTDTLKRAIEFVRRKEGRIDVGFVDYAQLLRDRVGDKLDTAKYIADELAAIPKKYDCHLVAISNLNRAGENYGTVFLDYGCDNWWIVQNDKATKDVEEKSGDAVIEIKYRRYGESGLKVPVTWHADYCRFTDRGVQLRKVETRYGR